MRFLSLLILLLASIGNQAFGQEELVPLGATGERVQPQPTETGGRVNYDAHPFIFVVDTLPLPFFDDFSTNRIKVYQAQQSDPNVSLKIQYDFRVNGAFPDTLHYLRDTTHSKLKMTNGQIIESPNPVLYIVLMSDGKIVGLDTGWTNIVTEFDQGSGIVSYDSLTPEVTLINTPDTFYKVADDNSLWVPPADSIDSNRSAPFINNRYPIVPITQGVATFDGTDRHGFAYDPSSETSYGLADVLTSKPLALDSNMDSVYLSFFYQAGGLGNVPDEEDSLVLEFFNVVDSVWQFAWKAVSDEVTDTVFSREVRINIDGRPYLQSGFQFRFRNFSTLSASMDHWHIDYVRVQQDLNVASNDTFIRDVAFLSGINSFLRPYQSVPYDHYLADPEFFDTNRVSQVLRNLGPEEAVALGLRYEIFDPFGNLVRSETTVDPNIGPFTVRKVNYPIDDFPIFPDIGTKYADFTLQSRYTSSIGDNFYQINDTIRTKQEFRHYYAYDDGTAEQAYALTGAGLKLAYEFNIPVQDTLKAVGFNFPQTLHNENEELEIEVLVWDDLSNEPIYVATQFVSPIYTKSNDFFRIELDTTILVSNRFYIGFRQIEQTKIYIGFDVNNDNGKRIHYQIGETWYTSSFKGSLLIRPDFGDGSLLAVDEVNDPSIHRLHLYPNPANDWVRCDVDLDVLKSIEVLDVSGRKVLLSQDAVLSTSQLSNGLFFVRARFNDGTSATSQLVIQH